MFSKETIHYKKLHKKLGKEQFINLYKNSSWVDSTVHKNLSNLWNRMISVAEVEIRKPYSIFAPFRFDSFLGWISLTTGGWNWLNSLAVIDLAVCLAVGFDRNLIFIRAGCNLLLNTIKFLDLVKNGCCRGRRMIEKRFSICLRMIQKLLSWQGLRLTRFITF